MLKKNKNRGAGLVTVVVVLAVSSILLSASIWLSFQHYKNVMTNKTNDDAYAELDLCAELVCLALDQKSVATLAELDDSENELLCFYGIENNVYDDVDQNVLIQTLGYSLRLSAIDLDSDFKNGLLIQYLKNGEVVAESTYILKKEDGKYSASHLAAVESSENETEEPA